MPTSHLSKRGDIIPSPLKKSFAAEQLKLRKKKRTTTITITILVVAVIVAVIAVGYALYMHFSTKEIPTEETIVKKPSIAVMPFVNMSADPEQDYFCDGMSEEIINVLTNVGGLRVIARTSAFFFKGKDYKIQDVGKELNVETVLEGSVRKADNQLRITAQLINVADESHIWSEKFDREMEDVFAIQDSISLAIVKALKIELLGEEKIAIEKRYTENIKAYELYLQGSYYRDKLEIQNAFEYFRQAIELDPNYALAYIGFADYYWLLGIWGSMAPDEAFPKSKAAIERALEIDDTIAEAYTYLARISLYYEWDWSAAESSYKQAIALNPGSGEVYHGYQEYYMFLGQLSKGLVEMKRAVELDPLSVRRNGVLMWYYVLLGRYDEAMEQFYKIIRLDPNHSQADSRLGLLYMRQNEYKKALENFIKASESEISVNIAWAYASLGDRKKAEQILNKIIEIKKEKYISSLRIAFIYFALEDYDTAFKWVDKAYEEHDSAFAFFKTWLIHFPGIRSDPRYKALMKKMGLPE
ncbi:tetratricopeptide repeat protein [Candidatus Latescibacterota bacterium]